MTQVKAYATQGATEKLTPFEFQQRNLTENDVLIDVLFCGVCHSDIHQARNEWGGATYPMVPGHEVIGKVKAVGANVKKFKIGDIAGVGCMVDSCKTCSTCKESEEQFCQNTIWSYNTHDPKAERQTFGGYSNEMIVNEEFALTIGANLQKDLARTAPLLCAGITTYSPLKRWNVKAGQKVAVMGLGGLGHMAIKFAVAMGAEVTVLSNSPSKESDAKALGANHFKLAKDLPNLLNTFDLILNTVSANIDYNQYISLLKPAGNMVLLGIQAQASTVAAAPLVMGKRVLSGSLIGGIKETQEMLDYCNEHNIFSDIEIIKMSQINEGFERILNSDVKYRLVVDVANSL